MKDENPNQVSLNQHSIVSEFTAASISPLNSVMQCSQVRSPLAIAHMSTVSLTRTLSIENMDFTACEEHAFSIASISSQLPIAQGSGIGIVPSLPSHSSQSAHSSIQISTLLATVPSVKDMFSQLVIKQNSKQVKFGPSSIAYEAQLSHLPCQDEMDLSETADTESVETNREIAILVRFHKILTI